MTTSQNTAARLESAGVIAIIRARTDAGLLEGARALARGGVTALEITLNTPGARDWLPRLRDELGAGGVLVGAGTILDAGDARAALDAGAQFIVTPTLQPESIAVCRERGVPICCGAFTPTEALAAQRAGAEFVKIFPAATPGPGYIRDLLAPLPFLKLVPTGGVTPENAAAFLRAGAVAVGAGSALYDARLASAGRSAELEARAREWLAAIAGARHA
jgi:2-dehydro-3-deoxyphosphogluconate aldolase/(4S)-4-hydroxy-2-oxoglutarate aldolase